MWLSVTECAAFVNYLEDKLDKKWLKSQFDKFQKFFEEKKSYAYSPTQKFHPLAYQIYNVKQNLEKIKQNEKIYPIEDILSLATIGHAIYRLKNSHSEGLEIKLKDLMSSNNEKVEKTKYELNVAKLFVNRYHKVKFVVESDQPSFDLLLDDHVEVECKRKDTETKEERINKNFFSQFVKKTQKIFQKKVSSWLVTVKTNQLNQEKVDELVPYLTDLIDKEKQGEFSFSNGKIILQMLAKNKSFVLQKKISDIDEISTLFWFNLGKDLIQKRLGYEFWHRLLAENKYFEFLPSATHLKDGTFQVSSINTFIFDSNIIPTKYESIRRSLKKAKNQFSGTKPSLIFVDMEYNPETVEYDYSRVEPIVEEFLRQNSSVSGITVTVEVHQNNEGKTVYYYDGKSFYNKSPKFPLIGNYEIFNELIFPIYTKNPVSSNVSPKNAESTTFHFICMNCRNKIFVQAKLVKNIPTLNNHQLFPKLNILTCPYCGNSRDLIEARKLIEEHTGKQILSD